MDEPPLSPKKNWKKMRILPEQDQGAFLISSEFKINMVRMLVFSCTSQAA